MMRSDQIISTVGMIQKDNLDVRTITMGINLLDCRHQDVDVMCRRVVNKIEKYAGDLVEVCDQIVTKYGVPIVNKRLAVSPAADVAAGHDAAGFVALAKAMDQAARSVGVDFIGGYSAQVQKGASAADDILMETLPQALLSTGKVCASINVGSTPARNWWFSRTSRKTIRSWRGRTMAMGSRKSSSTSASAARASCAGRWNGGLNGTERKISAWTIWRRRSSRRAAA